MKLGRSNISSSELNDIVDSMPNRSEFGMGGCGCSGLADVSASVGVGANGVNASGGFSWTTLLLIGLEWSAMFDISDAANNNWSLTSTILANLAKELQAKLEEMGLQGVQFTTVKSRWSGSAYGEQLVIEVTTPINRRRQGDLQWDMEQAAKQVGLNVDPNPAHNNLRLMKQGNVEGVTGGAQARPGTGDNKPPPPPPSKPFDWDKFLEGLGISAPFAVVGGALVLVIILRR